MTTTAPVYHLVIYSGYHSVYIGLYNHAKNLGEETLDKKTASAFLMQSILDLLKHHQLHFNDLSFIGAHSGPAPFTTLRIGITTANGIGFATKLPLIPVNGLETLSLQYPEYTVILNAFCEDVYVGKNGTVSCENIDAFLQNELKNTNQVTYIGNAVPLYHEKLKALLGDKVKILADYPYEASLDMIAQAAYKKWQEKRDITDQIVPAYLKQYSAKLS